jgi:hypothetical protein
LTARKGDVMSRRLAKWHAAWFALVAIALPTQFLAQSPDPPAGKKAHLLTRDEVATVWIGISDDETYLIRLSLNSRGDGTGAYSFVGEKPHQFAVPSWTYSDGNIAVGTDSKGQPGVASSGFKGKVVGEGMVLTARGKDWSPRFNLRREKPLVSRWDALRGIMTRPEE